MCSSYYYPHFRDDEGKQRRFEPSMPKVMHLGRGKAVIVAGVFLMSLACSLKLCLLPFETV